MKKGINISLIIIFILIINILILNFLNNKSQAATQNSKTSDVQLIARAINGEARGEPYEGQVAVRSSNIK